MALWVKTPKSWGDMTDAEKGALLLAEHEGEEIEFYEALHGFWGPAPPLATVKPHSIVRVSPKPKLVHLYWDPGSDATTVWLSNDTHHITFNLIDGEPDPASIKMEKIT